MDIQVEKYLLIERLKLVKDASLIQAIKSMLDNGLQNEDSPISIEQYNLEIDQSEADIDNGLGIGHEDLKREANSW